MRQNFVANHLPPFKEKIFDDTAGGHSWDRNVPNRIYMTQEYIYGEI
jgi:hypothetical protein